jgi:hypothetical protein
VIKTDISKLAELVKELDDDIGFHEFPGEKLVHASGQAGLFKVGDKELWFPYSQLRHLDGEFYATEWILKNKGLL